MDQSIRQRLDGVPLKPLKASVSSSPDALNLLESGAAAAILTALTRAGMSQKEAAITMEISEAQFTRQLRGQEHVSWQRLFTLPDGFWRELLIVLAEAKKLARVRRRVVFDMEASA